MGRERSLEQYCTELANFLGHPYWVFRVGDDYASDGWAEIHIEDYNEAEIRVSPKFWTAPTKTQTQVILHELLHISFIRQHEHLQDCISSLLEWVPTADRRKAKAQLDIHQKAALRAEELEVNRLAVLLSGFAPQFQQ